MNFKLPDGKALDSMSACKAGRVSEGPGLTGCLMIGTILKIGFLLRERLLTKVEEARGI